MRSLFVRSSLIALAAVLCQADTLTLRSGETVNGSWLGVDGDRISFLVGDRAVNYPRSSVAEVSFGDDFTPSSAPVRKAPKALSPSVPVQIPTVEPPPPSPPAEEHHPYDVVHLFDETGRIVPLEQAKLVKTGSASWEIKGSKSAFRIKRAPAMLFLVWLSPGEDAKKIHLVRLTSGVARTPYGEAAGTSAGRTVPLSVTTAADSTGLAPVGELAPGEYAFVRTGSNDAFCFGIDAK